MSQILVSDFDWVSFVFWELENLQITILITCDGGIRAYALKCGIGDLWLGLDCTFS